MATIGPDASQFQAVAAGDQHFLALNQDGTVTAWGQNRDWQLGAKLSTRSAGPALVVDSSGSPLTGVIAVAAGSAHSVALLGNGTVCSWGSNLDNQLGDGPAVLARNYAAPVPGITDVVQISAGGDHTLARHSDGSVTAWGYNYFGELGIGTGGIVNFPVKVHAPGGVGLLSGALSISAARYHSFALMPGGILLAWGINSSGQLGLNDNNLRTIPTPVPGVPTFSQVTGGLYHSLAVDVTGAVWAWGGNGEGQLGVGTTSPSLVPIQVSDPSGLGFLTNAAEVSCGSTHSVVRLKDNTVLGWGDNEFGAVGNDSLVDQKLPTPVVNGSGEPLTGTVAVVASNRAVVALGSGVRFSLRYPVSGVTDVSSRPFLQWDGVRSAVGYRVEVSTTADFSALVLDQGGLTQPWLVCPVALTSGTPYFWRVHALDGGGADLVAPTDSRSFTPGPVGRVLSFGTDIDGQLGNGSSTGSLWVEYALASEAPKIPFSGALQVSAGHASSAVLMLDGTVRTWGSVLLGDSVGGRSDLPVTVVDGSGAVLANVKQLSAGNTSTLALLTDSSLWFWGKYPLAGSGFSYAVSTGLTAVEEVSTGTNHWAVRMSDGTVRTIGYNDHGQLGDGSYTDSPGFVTALQSPGIPLSGVTQIVCGGNFVFALKSDGTVWSWGAEQGAGNADTATPTPVVGPGGIGTLGGVRRLARCSPDYGSWTMTAILNDDTAVVWGLGGPFNSTIPTPLLDWNNQVVQNIDSAAMGTYNLALLKNGTARIWGYTGPGLPWTASSTNRALLVVDRNGLPVTGITDLTSAGHLLLRQ